MTIIYWGIAITALLGSGGLGMYFVGEAIERGLEFAEARW